MTAAIPEPTDVSADQLAATIASHYDSIYHDGLEGHVSAKASGPVVDIVVDPEVGETKRFYFRIYEGVVHDPITDGH